MHHYSRVILLFIFSVLLIQAEESPHYYDTEQGFVEYNILGGAQLTDETNLNMQGTSTLRFKSWGNIRQEEDRGFISTTGAINYTQEIKRIEKHIEGKVIIVDYDNKQLLEHTESKSISSFEKEIKGLEQRGQAVVAGVLCKIWVGPSVKKCIYKGIVLRQESFVLGVSYKKEAVKAIFDINVTASQCILPQFPKNMFGMITDKVKTKKSDSIENVCKVFKDVVHEVEAENKSLEPQIIIDTKKRKKFINKITKGIFKKQKEVLPALFLAMKKSRECLHLANDTFERETCIKNYRQSKKYLGIQEDDHVVFGDNQKHFLDDVEDAIIDFAPRISCITRSQNFTDISSCMK